MQNNLFEHQKKIINDDPKKTLLGLGTGSSKTRIALELAKGHTLVICPKTQFEDKNWQRENEKWGCNVVLIVLSKEQFKKLASTLPQFTTVIIDEAETCLGVTPNIRYVKKEPRPKASQLFDELDAYLQRCPPERLYLVTATITRSPMTVWAAAKLLGKNFDFYHWRSVFYQRIPIPGREIYTIKTDSDTKNRLAKVVQGLGYIGRLSDYFDVPDQTYKTIYLELTDIQKKRIKELSLEYPDPIVLLGKKHQVENGILTGDEFNKTEIFDNKKIDTLLDFAIEFPRMVIFVKYTAQIEQIVKAFKKTDKKIFVLNGATKDRGALIKEANQTYNGIFIAQIQVSAGWELPEWPVMVFASMSYSVTDRIQAEGRIHRAHVLKKNLYIDLIVKGGIDEAVYKCIANKKDFNERTYLKL